MEKTTGGFYFSENSILEGKRESYYFLLVYEIVRISFMKKKTVTTVTAIKAARKCLLHNSKDLLQFATVYFNYFEELEIICFCHNMGKSY